MIPKAEIQVAFHNKMPDKQFLPFLFSQAVAAYPLTHADHAIHLHCLSTPGLILQSLLPITKRHLCLAMNQ